MCSSFPETVEAGLSLHLPRELNIVPGSAAAISSAAAHSASSLAPARSTCNNIEQLLAVSKLTCPEHLAGNCLMHYGALALMSGLARLLSTDLRHNPLSTHPRHREIASSWLHPALASLGPSLDTVPLSRSELLHVGSSRLIVSPSVSPARPVSGDQDQEAAPARLDSLETVLPECPRWAARRAAPCPQSVAAPGGGGGAR